MATIIGVGGNKLAAGDVQELRRQLASGEFVVALAGNLFTDIDLHQTTQSFITRTSGGTDSIRSGAAKLEKLYGAKSQTSTSSRVTESVSYTKVEAANFTATIDITVFAPTETGHTPGTYEFSFDGEHWNLSEENVNLEDFGIALTGTPISGDTFSITHENEDEDATEVEITLTYTYNTRLTVTLDNASVRTKGNAVVTYGQSTIFVLSFDGTDWKIGTDTVTLADYGVTLTGTPQTGDAITISYTREDKGTITMSSPTAFKALGLNGCNCFDLGSMVLENKTINDSGAIIDAQGSFVCYAKAVYNASNTSGYAVYDVNNSVTKVGWVATLPTAETTGITLGTPNAQLSHITFAADGYIVVACTNVAGICIHPSWSGEFDMTYNAYSESVIEIPTKSASGTDLVGCGWAVGSYKNTFDFAAKTYTQNVARVAYTSAALTQLLTDNPSWVEGTDYAYDNNWIYYHITAVVSNLASTADGVYYVNDYSIEEFVGTTVAPTADFYYGENLIDKLRSDVLTNSFIDDNKVAMSVTFEDSTTATYYILKNPLV